MAPVVTTVASAVGCPRVVLSFLVAFACAGALDDDDELAEKVGPLDYRTCIVPVLKY